VPSTRVRGSTAQTIDRRIAYSCTATWKSVGLTIIFWSDARSDPCYGRGQAATIVADGRRWRTDRGLRIGDSTPSLKRVYPHATLHPALFYRQDYGWWLMTRRCPERGSPSWASLLARVRGGRVAAFVIQRQGCA
jgi:hypothetical protein